MKNSYKSDHYTGMKSKAIAWKENFSLWFSAENSLENNY